MDELLVAKADGFAAAAHHAQTDKVGQPYIGHCRRVAARMDSAQRTIVALLHDVLEDTPVTEDVLRAEFGDEVTDAVLALTRRDDEGPGYYTRVRANELALHVKVYGDIADNTDPTRVAALPQADQERLGAKYDAALLQLTDGVVTRAMLHSPTSSTSSENERQTRLLDKLGERKTSSQTSGTSSQAR